MKPLSCEMVSLVIVEVADNLEAVAPELVIQQPVGDLDGGQDQDEVGRLADGEVDLIHCIPAPVLQELGCHLTRLANCQVFLLVLLLILFLPVLVISVAAASLVRFLEEIPSLLSSSQNPMHKIIFKILFPK